MITDVGVFSRSISRTAAALVAAACLWSADAYAACSCYSDVEAASAADTLLDALATTTDENARLDILHLLGEYRSDAVRQALEAIAGNGKEPGSVRMQAICSLAGSASTDSVPLLMRITETDLKERHGYWACAIPVLGQIKDRRAMPLLLSIARLKGDDLIGMDHMAVAAIANMADERDVPFLMSMAYNVAVRQTVIEALARIAAPSSCEVLIGALQDGEEPAVVAAAEWGLKAIGKAAIPFLKAARDQPMDRVFKQRVEKLLAEIR